LWGERSGGDVMVIGSVMDLFPSHCVLLQVSHDNAALVPPECAKVDKQTNGRK